MTELLAPGSTIGILGGGQLGRGGHGELGLNLAGGRVEHIGKPARRARNLFAVNEMGEFAHRVLRFVGATIYLAPNGLKRSLGSGVPLTSPALTDL